MVTALAVGVLAGTRGYLALEFNDGKHGIKNDVYSYGVVSETNNVLVESRHDMNFLALQVVLEGFTGLLTYSDSREDEKLVYTLG